MARWFWSTYPAGLALLLLSVFWGPFVVIGLGVLLIGGLMVYVLGMEFMYKAYSGSIEQQIVEAWWYEQKARWDKWRTR